MRKHLILDTDAGSDCDDIMALAYLLSEEARGSISLDCITYCFRSPYAPAALRATCRFFGRMSIPIGVGPTPDSENKGDNYCRQLSDAFASDEDIALPTENAVSLLRKTLAAAEEKVTVVAIGLMTNIAALLESGADGISPLKRRRVGPRKGKRVGPDGGKLR